MADNTLPLSARFWFAWAAFFRILFDGAFAYRAFQVREHAALPPPAPTPASLSAKPAVAATAPSEAVTSASPSGVVRGLPQELLVTRREGFGPKATPATASAAEPPGNTSALQLLALFQRDGRLIDFLEQEITAFSDAEVGVATRVVHEGCRKALHAHATLVPIRGEEEGVRVEIAEGYSPSEVKLTGNVGGSAPYRGVLQHRGWRASKITLPVPVAGHDASVIAPAEVEL